MNYRNYIENPHLLHERCEKNRAYYIPYKNIKPDFPGDRFASDRVTVLSGQWDFRYFESIQDFNFEWPVYGAIPYAPATIEVPSCWEIKGYGFHQYVNVKFPIPYDPPYVPDKNPCGYYERRFIINPENQSLRQYLNFEGVDSCFFVWVNGKYAGYSQVSHSTSEFDITSFLHEEENTIAVLVVKWCDGTYFEDQDKFRMSGIFRDVYILSRPEKHIRDFFVQTPINPSSGAASVDVEADYSTGMGKLTYTLTVPGGGITVEGSSDTGKIHIELESPRLWTAETPNLYELTLDTGEEKISTMVGIRTISIKNKVVLINYRPVKFKGVNRHDSSPYNGFSVSYDEMVTDLRLMKAHNLNAIRTSHCPNSPQFLELCDYYGFYVIDEADVEAHGVVTVYGGSSDKTFCLLADDDTYIESIKDRVARCVIRDKNRPSVLIWSMGNESGYGVCFEKTLAWVKEYDNSRLTHYESSIYNDNKREMDLSNLDLLSRMYPPHTWCKDYCEDPKSIKPLVLCEFVSAMGNGPGDIEEYMEVINSHNNFCGAFCWEWCDHAVYMGKTIHGKDKFFYGGDFGDFPHDDSFCVDGLVYPDRRPSLGLLEYKNCLRPVRARWDEAASGRIILRNMLDFTSTKNFISIRWELSKDGLPVQYGSIDAPDIPPHGEAEITIDYTIPQEGRCYLKLEYLQIPSLLLTGTGHVLGFDQLFLPVKSPATASFPVSSAGKVSFTENSRQIIISGNSFAYVFNKSTGLFDQLTFKNQPLLEEPMHYNIWRAPTENDRNTKLIWRKAGYDRSTVKVYEAAAIQEKGNVSIRTKLALSAVFIQHIVDVDSVITIDAQGGMDVRINAVKNPQLPFLPRFGIRMFLPKGMDQVSYTGYGPYESYIDKHQASYYGCFSSTVKDLYEDYIFPEENGSHWGCTELKITGNGKRLCIMGDHFSFNASHFTQEELTEKLHNFELIPSPYTVLCLDYQQSGIGSNNCGPELLEKYRLNGDFTFTVRLIPQG
jgi:beta-galactosidase